MKNVPQSITVTVRNGDNFRATRPGKTWDGDGASINYIRRKGLYAPNPPYRVTYTVTSKGRFPVVEDEGLSSLAIGLKDLNKMSVCFLPDSWRGLRVSRKVEKI
jgi:hypothetical protein